MAKQGLRFYHEEKRSPEKLHRSVKIPSLPLLMNLSLDRGSSILKGNATLRVSIIVRKSKSARKASLA